MFPVLPTGFPTPDSLPEETVCRTLTIPNETVFLACFMGALQALVDPDNWQQTGSVTPEEAAAAAFEVIDQSYLSEVCPVDTVDAPYWDTDEDVDDEMSLDDQPWYGTVEDASVPPDELTFIEDAAIWAFTGLIAVATVAEVGPAPAIAFRTIAPKFVVAIRTGDLGRIIRLFVDGSEAARVEDDGSGDIINMPVIADPALDEHQIYITAGMS